MIAAAMCSLGLPVNVAVLLAPPMIAVQAALLDRSYGPRIVPPREAMFSPKDSSVTVR